MIKLTKTFRSICAATIAAGVLAGFVVRCDEPLVQERRNEKTGPLPASWIGKQVITKYRAPFRNVRVKIFRVCTVEEIDGDLAKLLVFKDVSAWIELKELVLFDQAVEFYSQEIRAKPQNAAAYHERGLIWNFKREKEKAIADFTEAIRLAPNDGWSYQERADLFFKQREYDKAIADLTEGIRIAPRYSWFERRGEVWIAKSEYDKAIADYTEAIRIDPKFGLAFLGRGRAWSLKKEYDKAIADFAEVVRIDPDSPFAYNARAWLWATCPDAKHRDGVKGVDSARTACELTQWNNPNYLDTLATAYAETGDFEAAVSWQTKANSLRAAGAGKVRGEARRKLFEEKKPYRDLRVP